MIFSHPNIDIDPFSTICRTPLHLAAIKNHTIVAKILVENGSDPNNRDFDESTPLHCASEFGSIETLIFLLKEGNADPTLKNKFGYTPSDIAQNLETREAFDSVLNRAKSEQENIEGQES